MQAKYENFALLIHTNTKCNVYGVSKVVRFIYTTTSANADQFS